MQRHVKALRGRIGGRKQQTVRAEILKPDALSPDMFKQRTKAARG